MLFLLQTKRGKVTLKLSLSSVVRPHLLRHNLWIIMAKHMGEWKWSAPHLLWREHEHPKKGLLQSRSDRAWCMCKVKVLPLHLLGVKYYLLESNHCLLDAISPSEQYSRVFFIGARQHTLVSQQEKSSISGVGRTVVLNGWSFTTATAYYNSVWACVQQ